MEFPIVNQFFHRRNAQFADQKLEEEEIRRRGEIKASEEEALNDYIAVCKREKKRKDTKERKEQKEEQKERK
jgi:hypothetical protein